MKAILILLTLLSTLLCSCSTTKNVTVVGNGNNVHVQDGHNYYHPQYCPDGQVGRSCTMSRGELMTQRRPIVRVPVPVAVDCQPRREPFIRISLGGSPTCQPQRSCTQPRRVQSQYYPPQQRRQGCYPQSRGYSPTYDPRYSVRMPSRGSAGMGFDPNFRQRLAMQGRSGAQLQRRH